MTTLDYQSAGSAPLGKLRPIAVLLLLFVGLQLSLLIGHAMWPPRRTVVIALAAIAVLACLPPVSIVAAYSLNFLRWPTIRMRWLTAIVIIIASAAVLYVEAVHQSRTFSLKYQDEFSYAIQARMLAHGHLWMPAHPLADFFTNFQLLGSPIYGSIYFPGAALLFAPAIWLGLPFWAMPLILSAIAVGLLYLIVTDLIDGVAGILAAVMLLSLPIFRMTALMDLAQAPTLLLSLSMIAAWCAWNRSRRRVVWTIVIGAAAGWCAITRPVDAVITALPVGVAMLSEIRLKLRGTMLMLVLLIIGAAPFLAIQAAFNERVTHTLTESPFSYFAKLCYPQTEYGFHKFDPSIRPSIALPQVQRFYDEHAIPFLKDHTLGNAFEAWKNAHLTTTVINGTPQVLLLVLIPVALLGLTQRRRWVVVSLAPLFVLLYFPYVFFLTHYTLICAPAFIVLILVGASVTEHAWPRRRAMLATFLTAAIVMLSVSEMSFFNHSAWDEFFQAPELHQIDQALAPLSANGQRAIVLFRFDVAHGTGHIEPVYNVDVIWPDDAPVIRAHDLGDRNRELFEYYASRQPNRTVYLYDRATGTMTKLGRVDELAQRL